MNQSGGKAFKSGRSSKCKTLKREGLWGDKSEEERRRTREQGATERVEETKNLGNYHV